MKQTENYQLNQWEASDRILREDFNNDNLKLENALEGLKTLCNCQIYLLPYTGTGETGPITHTFPHRPMFVIFMSSNGYWACGMRGIPVVYGRMTASGFFNTPLVWDDRSITLGNADWSVGYCFNGSGNSYCIMALLDAAD